MSQHIPALARPRAQGFSPADGFLDESFSPVVRGNPIDLFHVALGATTPKEIRDRQELRQKFETGFQRALDDALEEAEELIEEGELAELDNGTWNAAINWLLQLPVIVPPPQVFALQFGGVSFEWHCYGMNIEIRFRVEPRIYLLVEDICGEVPRYSDHTYDLALAVFALSILAERQKED